MRLPDLGARVRVLTKGLGAAVLPLVVAGAVGHASAGFLPGGYDLTFSGDASFRGPHGGQVIHVTVETAGGEKVASREGTVSSTANPSFSFDFGDVLNQGQSYVIKYWIDSNFDGGTKGVCDEPGRDHQWKIDASDDPALGNVSKNVTIVDSHRPKEIEKVC